LALFPQADFDIDPKAKKADTRQMKLPGVILVLSLATNLILASVVFSHRKPNHSALSASGDSTVVDSNNLSSDQNGSVALPDPDSAAQPVLMNGFQWSQLESAEYKEYIARLRAFGVPEKVIRDIIIADVTKLYRPRFAALRPPKKPKNPNFWETRNRGYYPDRDATKEQREQVRALQKEQTELIKELLGADVYEVMAQESGYPDWTERQFGALPKETRDKISDMQQRFQEAQSEIYAKADGYIDQDAQAELAAARRKLRTELATVLTPEQLEEYELRSSETAQNMKWELAAFNPDEKEFRAIHAFKQLQEETTRVSNVDAEGQQTAEERKSQQAKIKELEAALKETLGADRVREYKLMEQYEYRNLFESGVSKESVFQVADMKSEVEKAASELRKNKALTDEQRREALIAIKAETEKSLAELLGSRRAKAYQSQGGWWLRNLVPPQKP